MALKSRVGKARLMRLSHVLVVVVVLTVVVGMVVVTVVAVVVTVVVMVVVVMVVVGSSVVVVLEVVHGAAARVEGSGHRRQSATHLSLTMSPSLPWTKQSSIWSRSHGVGSLAPLLHM